MATAASPLLLGRAPMVLACLSPRTAFLVVAAGETSLPVFLLLGGARLAVTDPLHYSLGRSIGTDRSGRLRLGLVDRAMARALRPIPGRVRLAARPACCVAVLLRPNGLNLLWAGSLRLPVVLVATLDLVGTSAYLLAVHVGADALIT